MRNQGQLLMGGALIILGFSFLCATIFHINLWVFCWPVGLILLGVWILARPAMLGSNVPVRVMLLGEIQREGAWQVASEEFWTGIGDVDLDFTQATIPQGETTFRLFGFVGSIKVLVPRDVGVAVSSTAFVSDLKVLGKKEENFIIPIQVDSDNYKTAERKIRLDVFHFVADVSVKQV